MAHKCTRRSYIFFRVFIQRVFPQIMPFIWRWFMHCVQVSACVGIVRRFPLSIRHYLLRVALSVAISLCVVRFEGNSFNYLFGLWAFSCIWSFVVWTSAAKMSLAYTCSFCFVEYRDRETCRWHERIHARYECVSCDCRFLCLAMLSSHNLIVHGELLPVRIVRTCSGRALVMVRVYLIFLFSF